MPGPAFTRAVRDISEGKILIPVIKAALSDPDFKEFHVRAEGWHSRPYDGWFHPSTHATWNVRQLWLYLTKPELMQPERPSLLFVLSVTQGKFWHDFVQTILFDRGMLMPRPKWEQATTITDKVEVPFRDRHHMRRGHADGRISGDELFEFKTMNDRWITRVKTGEDVRIHHPGYYAQTQDYLDMGKSRRMRYLVMALASPFPMAEVVVEADVEFQAAQRAKYAEAIQHAADQTEPPFCCTPKSKEAKACPVKDACPVGRLK
jgi:hypothetical protein